MGNHPLEEGQVPKLKLNEQLAMKQETGKIMTIKKDY